MTKEESMKNSQEYYKIMKTVFANLFLLWYAKKKLDDYYQLSGI